MTTKGIYLGRYRIDREIATGGMGTVYVARDDRLNRDVALKVLAATLLADPHLVERFRREARAVAALSHPNIANVFDYGEEEGRPVIAMELAPGRDLARILRDSGPLLPDRVATIGTQLCAALAHAHAAGIVHRDVKPANVIISDDDSVKVTDFGIARATGDEKLTVTGSVMGTAHYISPEQVGGGPITASSDIYSAGIVLYEMLTGAVPFTGDSLMAVALRHVNEDVPLPSATRPGIPKHLDAVVARATAKDARDRYRDADEMGRALSDEGDAATDELRRAGGDTAVLPVAGPGTPTPHLDQTVWPIPGTRWDPQRVGRWVLIVLGGLAVVAIVLLLARLGDTDRPAGQRGGEGTAARSPVPQGGVSFPMPTAEELIGANPERVASVLEGHGFEVSLVPIEESEFGVDVAEGEIVWSDPEPGSIVEADDTITLYVNAPDDGDEGDDPPGKAKGKDKEKD
ncbi:MAG: protein kinase [Actinomycetota bacterium]|nr:protein kinase [Actinomycetota bacterium]